jgi:hypothetical protein
MKAQLRRTYLMETSESCNSGDLHLLLNDELVCSDSKFQNCLLAKEGCSEWL